VEYKLNSFGLSSAIFNGPLFVAALVLLIFGVTSGLDAGWSSAQVVAPIVISVVLIGGFIYYETLIPIDQAAM
jgi:hypothetical protein